jgi:hypothetical protein
MRRMKRIDKTNNGDEERISKVCGITGCPAYS